MYLKHCVNSVRGYWPGLWIHGHFCELKNHLDIDLLHYFDIIFLLWGLFLLDPPKI